jgi:hypothetical protein
LRRIKLAEHVACTGEMKNAYTILDGKPEGRRPLGRVNASTGGKY